MKNDTLKNPYEALFQISIELNSMHEIMEILEKIMDIAMETLEAERGFILLHKGEKKKNFEPVTARQISKESITDLTNMSSSVVNRVLENGETILTYDAVEDQRFANAKSIQLQKIHSILCAPMTNNGSVIGAIYMDNRSNVGNFNEESRDFLIAFSRQASTAIENARLYEKLHSENDKLREQMKHQSSFPEIIGKSKKIREVFDLVRSVADSEATILIEGSSGTGKELIARAIHNNSGRKDKPFIPVFCGSLSETLLESELFGHKKGSFTGATSDKPGLFEEANGGTFFLDELGEISKNIQTKLLRVLQEGEIKRVGDNKIQKIDVRIIAASNKRIWDLVNEGEFREDLYYRLNVINIVIPELKERWEDIPLLAQHFLKMYCDKNKKYLKGISKDAMTVLQEYHWPGNIRELENTIERAVILAKETEIQPSDLQIQNKQEIIEVGMKLKDIEKRIVLKTLESSNNNRTKAAEVLGVSRRWLQYQLKEWGIVDNDSGV